MEFIEKFFHDYHLQIISTLAACVATPLLKIIIRKIIYRYGVNSQINDLRTKIVIKYVNILINILFSVFLITIWGVTPQWIFASFASVFAIVGVAFFAQWSLLSNVTAGLIIYFTVPFRIGDTIKILDKDNPIEAVVEDIKAFYINLRTVEGEFITIPNSLILQKVISIVNRVD
ncbi:mechanosensitive ion channel [Apibacter raozihei]|uniref:mechanosensitive ion channel domain-containing protein n=1 Tax=Apibacter TaxID=1778601 RepID=UPI000FE3B636|nr:MULTISPECIES: mechanosensitive ion channel domain-containing protein [Apibacter]